jgi:hypothetical protein
MRYALLLAAGLLATTIPFVHPMAQPAPEPGDHWWDIINTNGQVIWFDTDKVWAEGNRAFAIVRIAPVINGHSDYKTQTNVVVATDCRFGVKAFGTYEDWRNAPLDPARGMGTVLMREICRRAGAH